jgi:gluconokinase
MQVPGLCSPCEKTNGLVYFARMLAKVRLHAAGQLPAEFQENLGSGFDGRCCSFLGVDYKSVAEKATAINDDRAVLAWALETGSHPTEEQIDIWNRFMRKHGWRDDASERLIQRKQESNLAGRDDIQTMFDYIDADEGKPLRSWQE